MEIELWVWDIRDYCPSLVFVMWLLVRLVPLGARQIEDGGKVLKIRKKRIVSGIEQPWYFSFYFTSFYPEIEFLSNLIILYSMKIKEQTRKLVVGCSKHSFEVADKADVIWRDFRRVLLYLRYLYIVLSGSIFKKICQITTNDILYDEKVCI